MLQNRERLSPTTMHPGVRDKLGRLSPAVQPYLICQQDVLSRSFNVSNILQHQLCYTRPSSFRHLEYYAELIPSPPC